MGILSLKPGSSGHPQFEKGCSLDPELEKRCPLDPSKGCPLNPPTQHVETNFAGKAESNRVLLRTTCTTGELFSGYASGKVPELGSRWTVVRYLACDAPY